MFLVVVDATKFKEAAKNGNLVPLHTCIFSDQLTPVTAYRCLVKADDRDAPSFLFESVEPGSRVSSVVRALQCFLVLHIGGRPFFYHELLILRLD